MMEKMEETKLKLKIILKKILLNDQKKVNSKMNAHLNKKNLYTIESVFPNKSTRDIVIKEINSE